MRNISNLLKQKNENHYIKRHLLENKDMKKLKAINKTEQNIFFTNPKFALKDEQFFNQPKNQRNLNSLKSLENNTNNKALYTARTAYEHLELDSDSDRSKLDKEQLEDLKGYLKSTNNFVEKKTVTYFFSPKKVKQNEDKNFFPLSERKYNNVHKFFKNVYEESKEKTAKLLKVRPVISGNVKYERKVSRRLSMIEMKGEGDGGNGEKNIELPILKFFSGTKDIKK
jgi:hypothetical protein